MVRTLILRIGGLCKNKQGFSLLEILIVLVIMSLILSIVIPNFNKMFASVEGAREGSKVLRLFEKIRAEAIVTAKPQTITFGATGKCSFEYRGKLMEYEDLQMTVLLDEEEIAVSQTFKPDGTAKYPQLIFETTQGKYVTYNFNQVNGKIEMERSPEQ